MFAPGQVIPTYIGRCCREWVLVVGGRGTCGVCGEAPTYVGPDPGPPVRMFGSPRR